MTKVGRPSLVHQYQYVSASTPININYVVLLQYPLNRIQPNPTHSIPFSPLCPSHTIRFSSFSLRSCVLDRTRSAARVSQPRSRSECLYPVPSCLACSAGGWCQAVWSCLAETLAWESLPSCCSWRGGWPPRKPGEALVVRRQQAYTISVERSVEQPAAAVVCLL